MEKVFRYRSCSQTLNGHLLSFLVLWDKIFPSEKCDFLLLCRKFIEIGVFLKQWRVPPRIFSVLRDKVVPAEKLHISLVGVNLFDTWKILKHTNVHLRKFSTLIDYNFHWKIVIPSPHIQKKTVSDIRIILKHRRVPIRHYSPKRHRKIPKKAVITPNMEKIFRYRSSFETLNGHLLSFLVLWDKIFPTEKCDFLLLCRKIVEIGFFSNREGFLCDHFRY